MNKGRKQKLKAAEEYDMLYARNWYCYLRNNHGMVKHMIKRQMNRRYRRDLQKDLETEVNYAINEERQED